ncbi:hypothetical protein AAHA92_25848 [Salvia divinorum]|uniref:Uncharacterized protein n=1 Tax=Salvia divinorum TaxID=28513 RepID=A0ABD1GCM9_SALDI
MESRAYTAFEPYQRVDTSLPLDQEEKHRQQKPLYQEEKHRQQEPLDQEEEALLDDEEEPQQKPLDQEEKHQQDPLDQEEKHQQDPLDQEEEHPPLDQEEKHRQEPLDLEEERPPLGQEDTHRQQEIAFIYVDLKVGDVTSISHRSTTIATDTRLIPPRNDTPCLSILGRGDKPLVLAVNYHNHIGSPLVNFYGVDEGRRSTILCAFDPGGDTSPKLLFSTIFVASWFSP